MEEKLNNIIEWLNEKNIEALEVIDLRNISSEIEYLVVGTASSVRHGQTLSDYLEEKGEQAGYELRGTEGRVSGSWILMDYSEIVVNIFLEAERKLYNLEKLWADGKFVLPTRK